MEDRLFVSSLCFPLLLADFVNYLISLFIKPAVFLVNLFTEFSVGFIYLGLQLAALLINFVTFVFFGGFSSELSLCLIEFFVEFLLKFFDLPIIPCSPPNSLRSNGYATRLDIANTTIFTVLQSRSAIRAWENLLASENFGVF